MILRCPQQRLTVTLRDSWIKWATLEEEKEVVFGQESTRGHRPKPKEQQRSLVLEGLDGHMEEVHVYTASTS